MPVSMSESLAFCAIALSATRASVTVHEALLRAAPCVRIHPPADVQQHALATIAGLTTLGYAMYGGSHAVFIANVGIQTFAALMAVLVHRHSTQGVRQ